MTDEAVSSLGLGILRKKNCLKKIRWLKNTGASDDPGHTNGNYNDEALWNIFIYINYPAIFTNFQIEKNNDKKYFWVSM